MMRRLCAWVGFRLLAWARVEKIETRTGPTNQDPLLFVIYVVATDQVAQMSVPLGLCGAASAYANLHGLGFALPELKIDRVDSTTVH